MGSKYWIKLYHEILDDPKMGRLDDRLYRRTIEVFLLAGDFDKEGILPPVEDMAWRLRMSEEELETDLIELQRVSIVHNKDGQWIVTKFAERQAPVPTAERVARFRERKRQEEYYGTEEEQQSNDDVTIRYTDTDTDKKKKIPDASASGDEPKKKTKTKFQENMEHLEAVFAEARGTDPPDWDKDPKAANKRWRTPLGQIFSKCGKDLAKTEVVIRDVTNKMKREGLTFDAPDQILKTASSYVIDLKENKVVASAEW